MAKQKVTVGDYLLIDFLAYSTQTVETLAVKCGLNPLAIENLIHEKIKVTNKIAEGLAKGTGMAKDFWLGLGDRKIIDPAEVAPSGLTGEPVIFESVICENYPQMTHEGVTKKFKTTKRFRKPRIFYSGDFYMVEANDDTAPIETWTRCEEHETT